MATGSAQTNVLSGESSSGRVEITAPNRLCRDHDQARWKIWRELHAALPRIDSKYFYDDRGSHLFEDITRLPEYYQTRTEEALLESIADDIVSLTSPRELVELGSGAGRKIQLLLDAMHRRRQLDRCVLLDVNEAFLATSAERLATDYPGLEVQGIVGDFLHDLDAVGAGRRRLFLFFAGTIGNIHPGQLQGFLRKVRRVLGRDDAFLVGLDLVKDTRVLESAYNDSAGVTADFNRNILRVLNRRFGTDFEVDAFEHVAFYDADREWIEMRVRACRPTTVSLGGETEQIQFDAGDEIRTEISCKFTRLSFVEALFGTGLELWRWWTDPDALFALALVRST
jgi:L-histidine N-alpha-methyltransferase